MDVRFLHALRTSRGLTHAMLWRYFENHMRERRYCRAHKIIDRRIEHELACAWEARDRAKYDYLIALKHTIDGLRAINDLE